MSNQKNKTQPMRARFFLIKSFTLLIYLFSTFFSVGKIGVGSAEAFSSIINPPTILSVIGGSNQLLVTWIPVSGAKSYKVYYGTSSGVYGASIKVGQVPVVNLTGLKSGTTYYLAVTAIDSKQESPKSKEKSGTTFPDIATAPVLNTVIGGNHQATLNWSAVTGAKWYKIYLRSAQGRFGRIVLVNNVTTHTVRGLKSGTTYYFKVSAINLGGVSPKSNEKSALTLPRRPHIHSAVGEINQVKLIWDAVPSATSYKIYYGTSPNVFGTPVVVDNVTQYIVAGLEGDTQYYFAVAAVNSTGEGKKSHVTKATTLSDSQVSVPTASIMIDPTSISQGQTATLSWQCTDADTCTITPDIGSVVSIGNISVSPTTTTTYTVTAIGQGGTDTKSVTLSVLEIKPAVTIFANPQTIQSDASTNLSWTSTNASSLYVDNGIGLVANSGTLTISPKVTTTYTITATGSLGSVNEKVTVYVTGAPITPPEGTFGAQYKEIIPTDSTVKEYDIKRFAVVRGEVKDKNNAPLPDVAIVVDRNSKFGTAKTDSKGQFSLPVDSNGTLNIVFTKQGYIDSHRQVHVAPNDIAIVETVTMLVEDAKATTVTLNGDATSVIVHQSTPVTDVSGIRQANVVIVGDNKAYAVDENGNDMLELTKLSIRATEFTTPASMPAVLPPTSAFTYCVELKADGVDRVRFKDPVVFYVDNFLGFDVGEIVPVGYYDRDRGQWVASDNGRVVKLLDTNSDGIVDALDSDNDGLPNDLNSNGDFTDEVKGLDDPAKYASGKTFWRASITHFTPWDLNWPIFVSADAIAPNATGTPNVDQQKKKDEDCDKSVNSYVNCRSRIYHEDIAIPGTGLTLHFASNRVPDYKTIITVPASGATVPPSLKRIVVRVDIAGRTFEKILPASANQIAEFSWDGLDHLGHRVNSATAYITTEFVYNMMYSAFGGGVRPAVFGLPGVSQSAVPARDEYMYSKKQSFLVYNQAQAREGLAEGWTLSNHHYMSARDISTLYKGNGDVVNNNGVYIISTVAGTGVGGYSEDGVPADKANLNYPVYMAVDQNGNIYISENNRIRKIDLSGIIQTFAGTGAGGYSGDGGPATAAQLNNPSGITVDQYGNILIADSGNHRIRKVDVSGVIKTIAGTGFIGAYGSGGYSGDGGPAIAAKLNSPTSVAVDQNGNIYFLDKENFRIRKIDTDGVIKTIAGKGSWGYPGSGVLAVNTPITYPSGLATDENGNIYFADTISDRIFKIDSEGILRLIAGTGRREYSGDGGLAAEAGISHPSGLELDKLGNIYFSDSENSRIRKIDATGIITTIAGNGVFGYNGDNYPAIIAQIANPQELTLDNLGNVYFADSHNHRIRKITATISLTPADPGDMTFAEEGVGYVFSLDGKHKQTVDLDTQKVLEQFDYDASGRLVSSTDLFNNKITVERNGAGVPTAIVSPDGVRTNLTIDSSKHLTRITYPDGQFYKFEYSAGGLLTKETEPKGNFFTHTFNSNGRITDVQDQEGGHEKFAQQIQSNSGDVTTTVTSAEGNIVTYVDQISADGTWTATSSVSGVTKPTIFTRTANELIAKVTSPDLTVQDFNFDIDPKYKFKYLKTSTITTPAGLKAQVVYNRTYTDTNNDQKIDRIVRTASLNNKTSTVTHDTITSTFTAMSPLGRKVTAVYDPTTLLTSKVSVPGLVDTSYTYDFKGRVNTVVAGTRTTSLIYDLAGNVQSVTDPRGNRTSYTYDAVGRLKAINRPDTTNVRFDYDANGNMTVLTNPSSQNHGYIYNNVNLPTSYAPPISLSTQYVYDKERRLKEVNFPSGKKIKNIYTGVQLTQVQTPEGNVDPTYLPSGQLASITKSGESIAYTYDGSLPKTVVSTGTLAQTLAFTFNNDLKIAGFTYAGATNSFGYDNDGLLTSSGIFSITRNAQNGLPTAVIGGALNLGRTFNGFGEVTTQSQTVNSAAAGSWTLTYNNNGQIATKSETVAGITSNYVYTYDSLGRLTKVEKDNTLVEEYRYTGSNPLGTRTYEMNSLRGIAGRSLAYNAEDQLLSVGSVTYQYDADGFLSRKTDGSSITTYNYSSRGELLQVSLPDGRTIEYIHDPLGRRIAKKINGSVVEKYLWAGLTQLLAVYDGSNNLLMRFEYSDSRMPSVMTKDSATYYLSYDQVGSLRAVMSSTGAIVKRIDYDSFGNILADTAPAFSVPFGFAGGLHDRDVGLVRFGFRDYDPATGRWTAKDPIGFDGGDVDLYGYVESDPINFVDPYGLIVETPSDYVTWQLSLYYFLTEPGLLTGASLAYDSVALGTPFLPGGAGYVQGGGKVAKGICNLTKSTAHDSVYLYQKLDKAGKHLKYGISKNPASRYTAKELDGGKLKILTSGNKKDMLSLESDLHKYLPIGPEEGQSVYIEFQKRIGYKVPPY
ncbi:MAG: fibronectin type III domain-containing protein [Candidatus Omnitrophica bacterium]|nr:fibronectin type III domain-containing protein [Candidatus Omnitrophota bacterium]